MGCSFIEMNYAFFVLHPYPLLSHLLVHSRSYCCSNYWCFPPSHCCQSTVSCVNIVLDRCWEHKHYQNEYYISFMLQFSNLLGPNMLIVDMPLQTIAVHSVWCWRQAIFHSPSWVLCAQAACRRDECILHSWRLRSVHFVCNSPNGI